MRIIKTKLELLEVLENLDKRKIGFVPTMGALHKGHISLLQRARKENKFVVSSIFVNPKQFTNIQDLENYPRPLEQDLTILRENKIDLAFIPESEDIYREKRDWNLNLDGLDEILEGSFRPGHFQGVTQIVKILFELIQPHRAYFGLKDFQQFLIIKKLTQIFHLPIEIIGCPIIRETDGLALSSRNIYLSPLEREMAPIIFQSLKEIQNMKPHYSLIDCLDKVRISLLEYKELEIEYLEIADVQNLKSIKNWQDAKNCIVLAAIKLGQTRLIDNLILN